MSEAATLFFDYTTEISPQALELGYDHSLINFEKAAARNRSCLVGEGDMCTKGKLHL